MTMMLLLASTKLNAVAVVLGLVDFSSCDFIL